MSAPPAALDPRPRLRALDRWVVPERLASWNDTAPERYWLGLPLMPKVLFTCSPEDTRTIFGERDGALRFGEGLVRLAPHKPMFGRDALERLDGADHTRVRRALTAVFHGEALKAYERRIFEITERHMADWPLERPVRFFELSRDLVRDVIAAVIFGITEPGRAARLREVLNRLETEVNSAEMAARMAVAVMLRGRWAPYPSMERQLQEIEEITREEIVARRAAHAGAPSGTRRGDDCLDRFLELEGEDAFGDDDIVTAMRVLLVAGWATSANTVAWLIERLAHNPAALDRCHADVDAGTSRYLIATVQETLRMRPTVPYTMRYVAREFDLNGITLRRGNLIAIDIERMHRRRDIYPEPGSFRPERFLEERPGTYTWVPFGGGMHRCIGAGFALTEARLILSTMLKRLTLKPAPGPGERSRRTVLITVPAGGATVTLQPRITPRPR